MEQLKVEDFSKNKQVLVVAYGWQKNDDQNSISRRLKVSKFEVVFLKGHNLNTGINFFSEYTKMCAGK